MMQKRLRDRKDHKENQGRAAHKHLRLCTKSLKAKKLGVDCEGGELIFILMASTLAS